MDFVWVCDEHGQPVPRKVFSKRMLKLTLNERGVPWTPRQIDGLFEDGPVFESDLEDVELKLIFYHRVKSLYKVVAQN